MISLKAILSIQKQGYLSKSKKIYPEIRKSINQKIYLPKARTSTKRKDIYVEKSKDIYQKKGHLFIFKKARIPNQKQGHLSKSKEIYPKSRTSIQKLDNIYKSMEIYPKAKKSIQ